MSGWTRTSPRPSSRATDASVAADNARDPGAVVTTSGCASGASNRSMLESGIGRAHNLHLSTLPNFRLPGDVAASRRYYDPDLIEPPIDVRNDGTICVPGGPGIGVTLVPDRIARATVRAETLTEP